jgi:hypothetical protein
VIPWSARDPLIALGVGPPPRSKVTEDMELAIAIRIEKLPEGVYLATSGEIQGLIAQAAPSRRL